MIEKYSAWTIGVVSFRLFSLLQQIQEGVQAEIAQREQEVLQNFLAQEHADNPVLPSAPAQETSWLQSAWSWTQNNVITPVAQTIAAVSNSVSPETNAGGGGKLAAPALDDPPPSTVWDAIVEWWSQPWFWVVDNPTTPVFGNVLYPNDALYALTGNPVITVNPKDISIVDLEKKHDEGYAIVVSTPFKADPGNMLFSDPTSPSNLIASHVYYVSEVDGANNIVEVRNPWGWNDALGSRLYISLDYSDFQNGFDRIDMSSTSTP
jgi:hypothetical protein